MAARKLPGQASPSNVSGAPAAAGGSSAMDAEENTEGPAFEALEDHPVVHRTNAVQEGRFPPKPL